MKAHIILLLNKDRKEDHARREQDISCPECEMQFFSYTKEFIKGFGFPEHYCKGDLK